MIKLGWHKKTSDFKFNCFAEDLKKGILKTALVPVCRKNGWKRFKYKIQTKIKYNQNVFYFRSSGQSGWFDGCDFMNGSNLESSSLILEIVGNFDMSTLNLYQSKIKEIKNWQLVSYKQYYFIQSVYKWLLFLKETALLWNLGVSKNIVCWI